HQQLVALRLPLLLRADPVFRHQRATSCLPLQRPDDTRLTSRGKVPRDHSARSILISPETDSIEQLQVTALWPDGTRCLSMPLSWTSCVFGELRPRLRARWSALREGSKPNCDFQGAEPTDGGLADLTTPDSQTARGAMYDTIRSTFS